MEQSSRGKHREGEAKVGPLHAVAKPSPTCSYQLDTAASDINRLSHPSPLPSHTHLPRYWRGRGMVTRLLPLSAVSPPPLSPLCVSRQTHLVHAAAAPQTPHEFPRSVSASAVMTAAIAAGGGASLEQAVSPPPYCPHWTFHQWTRTWTRPGRERDWTPPCH